MSTSFASLVVHSARAVEVVAFWRAAGVPLADEEHDDGPRHWACELGGVHVAVYAHTDASPSDDPFPGIYVDDLDAATARMAALGVTPERPHEERPWGCRIVVRDPEGRRLEINQKDHCG